MTALKKLFRLTIITITVGLLAGSMQVMPPVDAQSLDGIVVDHTSVDLFDDIPEAYIQAAAAMDMLFIDRSVGANISDGLSCLSQPSDSAPNHCKRHEHVDPTFSVSPDEVDWNRPEGYDRSNWDYEFWGDWGGSTHDTASWDGKVGYFLDRAEAAVDQYDVLSFQFSYLSVDDGSTIADPSDGFFVNDPNRFDVTDLEAFEVQHSDKTFIYWTTSLARPIGTSVSESFNNQMRTYAIANDKPLFDVADILSHDPDGNPCYDNRDGVSYDNGNGSENHPDDGLNIPAICQHYTSEVEGGHLGNVSAGKIRVAKAFWVLMAQIAGWTPDNNNPPPTSTPTPTVTPTPTSTPTPHPTPTPIPPLSLTGAAADRTIHLFWTVNISLPPNTTWEIIYSDPNNGQHPPVTGLSDSTRSYSLTSLTNYTHYTINLNAIADGEPLVTDTVSLFPTDQLLYLPILLK